MVELVYRVPNVANICEARGFYVHNGLPLKPLYSGLPKLLTIRS